MDYSVCLSLCAYINMCLSKDKNSYIFCSNKYTIIEKLNTAPTDIWRHDTQKQPKKYYGQKINLQNTLTTVYENQKH